MRGWVRLRNSDGNRREQSPALFHATCLSAVSEAHAMLPHVVWLGILIADPYVRSIRVPVPEARALNYDRMEW